MEHAQNLLVILVSLGLVTVGAEFLVRGASWLALRAGVSALFVGLTIVGFGTSSPELGASLTATLKGSSGVSVGNVIGSNLFNIGVILGVTALIQPVRVALTAVRRDLLVAIVASFVPWLSLGFAGALPRASGLVMLGALAAYLVIAYRAARAESRVQTELAAHEVESTLSLEPRATGARDRVLLNVGLVVGGLALLVLGSQWFVGAAIDLAQSLGVSDLLIGLTVVAAGTSLPELVTSVVAARRGNPDIAVGNIIGSNIFNLLGILGACTLVAPQRIEPRILWFDAPVMVVLTLALVPLLRSGGVITRREGLLILAIYVTYSSILVARGG